MLSPFILWAEGGDFGFGEDLGAIDGLRRGGPCLFTGCDSAESLSEPLGC